MEVAAALAAGLIGVALGAWLARRNEKQAATERLLIEAINDLVDAVAGVAQGVPNAQAQYGSALARLERADRNGGSHHQSACRKWRGPNGRSASIASGRSS